MSQRGFFADRIAPTRTRAQRNKSRRVIPGCLLSSHASGKIRAYHLTQTLVKEDHADPCIACSSLEMKPEPQRRSRSSSTSEHQQLRKLPRCGSGGMKFRHGLAPRLEKVSDNDIVFRQYYTNRQEKFWSNLAHQQDHRGATTRRHAGFVALGFPFGAPPTAAIALIHASPAQSVR